MGKIACEVREKVVAYINKAKEKYNISNDMLLENGSIYYMNGEYNTAFNWDCNYNTCEFMCFYKKTTGNCICVYVTTEGQIKGCVFLEPGYNKVYDEIISLETENITENEKYLELYAMNFANALISKADDMEKFNCKLEDIPSFLDIEDISISEFENSSLKYK